MIPINVTMSSSNFILICLFFRRLFFSLVLLLNLTKWRWLYTQFRQADVFSFLLNRFLFQMAQNLSITFAMLQSLNFRNNGTLAYTHTNIRKHTPSQKNTGMKRREKKSHMKKTLFHLKWYYSKVIVCMCVCDLLWRVNSIRMVFIVKIT